MEIQRKTDSLGTSLGDSDPDQVWLLLFGGIKIPAVKHISEPTEIYGVMSRA